VLEKVHSTEIRARRKQLTPCIPPMLKYPKTRGLCRVSQLNDRQQVLPLDLKFARQIDLSNNRQLRKHRFIQQINRLLEPFILDKRSICLFSCLHRCMAQQVLNICNGSTAAQQASGKCLSKIVRGNVGNASSPKRSFQCSIVLYQWSRQCWIVQVRQ